MNHRRIALRASITLIIAGAVAIALSLGLPGGSPTSSSRPRRVIRLSKHPARDAFQVVAISPDDGATGISATASISIELSAPVSSRSSMPSIGPSVPGTWKASGDWLIFTPSQPFVPLSEVTLTVPAGSDGLIGSGGERLMSPVADNFTIANGSTLRLQQLLALLDYSPLSWTPDGTGIVSDDTGGQLAAMYEPPAGTFAWRNSGWPSTLEALWQEGSYNVFTRGLVMSFQADHGLIVNGETSGGLWNDLLEALVSGDVNTGGYNYALGDKTAPESLTIWHDGTVVLHSAANSGIPQSPTPLGTFPVYARYRNEVMRGTNPDGVPYADPVQYVAYFYDGDAVHYFPRADYGVPQSLGCLELPLPDAAAAWPYLAYGTLVTVVN